MGGGGGGGTSRMKALEDYPVISAKSCKHFNS